jgi:hypothetical protein
LLGYRPGAVDEALAARDEAVAKRDQALAASAMALVHGRERLEHRERRIAELDLVCDSLCARIVERERELERLRVELEHARAGEGAAAGALPAEVGAERAPARIEEELDHLRREARAQATRIRLAALREVAEVSRRITELTQRPAESRERLLRSVNDAITRIGGEPGTLAGAGPNAAGASFVSDIDVSRHTSRIGTPPTRGGGGPPPRSPERANGGGPDIQSALFDGMVEVEVGPLADFSQLVGFEDAAGGIAATSQISVTRFAQGRATLEMRLAEPVELLRELEERSPFEFRVRDQRTGRVVLDVDDE